MMHLAVHDALNAIERRYEPYLYEVERIPPAAPAAAIAAAARDVLVGVIPAWGKPEQRAKALAIVESAYAAALAKVPDGSAQEAGHCGRAGCSRGHARCAQGRRLERAVAIHARDSARTVAASPQSRAPEPADPRPGPRCRQLAGDASAVGPGGALHDGDAMAVPPAWSTRPWRARSTPGTTRR